MHPSKQAVAQRLADAHYALEAAIDPIVELLGSPEEEADPKQPIKMLQATPNTPPTGIHPVFFGAHKQTGIDFPCVIVEVTPEEYEDIKSGRLTLPNGWRLGETFARPVAAAVGASGA